MRIYIDGVLRFGIPPRFFTAIIKPEKGFERKIISSMIDVFADPKTREMYGSKEEIGDTEDFYPFVLLALNT